MVARMCEKMKIYLQYHEFKGDEKKYRRPGKRTYSVNDARRQFTQNMKQIKKKRDLMHRRSLVRVVK